MQACHPTDQGTAGFLDRNFQQATATSTCCGSWLTGRRRPCPPWSPCRAGESFLCQRQPTTLRACSAELAVPGPCLPLHPSITFSNSQNQNVRRCCSQDVESTHTLPLRCAKWAARGVGPKRVNGERFSVKSCVVLASGFPNCASAARRIG